LRNACCSDSNIQAIILPKAPPPTKVKNPLSARFSNLSTFSNYTIDVSFYNVLKVYTMFLKTQNLNA